MLMAVGLRNLLLVQAWTTRAKIAYVRETDINLANKWREVESAKGSDINEECMQV